MLNFLSDNTVGASPEVIEALIRVNEGADLPYGQDRETLQLRDDLRQLFEHDALDVLPAVSGCAANCIALSAMIAPDQAILCHELAHIHTDERGGPEFYTGGGKLIAIPAEKGLPGARLEANSVQALLAQYQWEKEHVVLPAALSLTQLTERGTCYSLSEIETLCNLAKDWGLRVHMDGARFANAMVSLGCRPADMTWRAGVDVLSFGVTKNGAIAADPMIFFDPDLASRAKAMRKRGGHTLSKFRFISAQVRGMLADDLWLRNAHQANAVAAKIAENLPNAFQLMAPVEGNELFITAAPSVLDRLLANNVLAYRWRKDMIRLVCSWAHQIEEAEAFLKLCQGASKDGQTS